MKEVNQSPVKVPREIEESILMSFLFSVVNKSGAVHWFMNGAA
jgi:hypothetical protein